jgi:hypothetical protein
VASCISSDRKIKYRFVSVGLPRYILSNDVVLVRSARELAAEAGWNLQALLNNPTYCSLHRSRSTCLEAISKSGMP